MSESKNIVLEERGYFWWHGEAVPKSCYASSFGVPGVLTIHIHENGRARLKVTETLLRFTDIASRTPQGRKASAMRARCSPHSR